MNDAESLIRFLCLVQKCTEVVFICTLLCDGKNLWKTYMQVL